MKQSTWFATFAVFACASAAVPTVVPHRDEKAPEVQVCGENAVQTAAPKGHVACALKNGQVINLRSAK